MTDPFGTNSLLMDDFCGMEYALLRAADESYYFPTTPCTNITIELMKAQAGEERRARNELEGLIKNFARMAPVDRLNAIMTVARRFACAEDIQQKINTIRWCVEIENKR